MATPLAILNVVGLTRALLEHAPRISAYARRQRVHTLTPVLPAVTCSVQASMITGKTPQQHGIVANGWYDRTLGEVQFWKQSNRLIHAEKVWDVARQRDENITTAYVCWWYAMNGGMDYVVTPRPIYKADGRKLPDCWTRPLTLRDELQNRLGTFPLFNFWGPLANIHSSQWIADAARYIHQQHRPTLNFVYLPHLDYPLQKFGPDDPRIAAETRRIDAIVGELIDYYQQANVRVMIVSEYGIEATDKAITFNRVLRQNNLLQVRVEDGRDVFDPMGSRAFAVCDHQVAHVYVDQPSNMQQVIELAGQTPGIEHVLDREGQKQWRIDHARAGELVLVAARGCWFAYDYWLDERCAPDYARTVDIHRKPGYDPRELFIDHDRPLIKTQLAMKIMGRKLGLRTLLDVIPLETGFVRGSHGRVSHEPDAQPLLITADHARREDALACTAVFDAILQHLFD